MTRLRTCIAFCLLNGAALLSACALKHSAPNTLSADFDQFYQAHGADQVLGAPVGKTIIFDELLSVRCFVGGCLQRHAGRELSGRITLAPLPEGMRPLQPPVAQGAENSGLLFRETGHFIQGELKLYFQRHGGVRFFGYPLGPIRALSNHQFAQHFERAILIWDNSLPSEQSVHLEPVGHIIHANLTGKIKNNIKLKSEDGPETAPANAAIAAFVQAHADRAVFGDPLSQPDTAADGTIEQVFNNVVIVADPRSPGGARLRELGILVYGNAEAPQPPSDVPGAAYFPSTGHSVLAAFKTYYDLHGGEKIFGSPITEAFVEDGVLTQYFENIALVWRQDAGGHGVPGVVPKELGLAYSQGFTSTQSVQPANAVLNAASDFTVHAWVMMPFALPQDRQEINILVMDLESQPIIGATASLDLDTSQGTTRLLLPTTGVDGRSSVAFPVSLVGGRVPTVNYRLRVEVDGAIETIAQSFNIRSLRNQ